MPSKGRSSYTSVSGALTHQEPHHQPGIKEGMRGLDGKGEGTAVNVSSPSQVPLPKLFVLPFVFPKPPWDNDWLWGLRVGRAFRAPAEN